MGSAGSVNGRRWEDSDPEDSDEESESDDSEDEEEQEAARERKEMLQRAAVVKLQPKPVDVTDAIADDEAEEMDAVANFNLDQQVERLWSNWDTTAASAAKIIGRAAWGTPELHGEILENDAVVAGLVRLLEYANPRTQGKAAFAISVLCSRGTCSGIKVGRVAALLSEDADLLRTKGVDDLILVMKRHMHGLAIRKLRETRAPLYAAAALRFLSEEDGSLQAMEENTELVDLISNLLIVYHKRKNLLLDFCTTLFARSSKLSQAFFHTEHVRAALMSCFIPYFQDYQPAMFSAVDLSVTRGRVALDDGTQIRFVTQGLLLLFRFVQIKGPRETLATVPYWPLLHCLCRMIIDADCRQSDIHDGPFPRDLVFRAFSVLGEVTTACEEQMRHFFVGAMLTSTLHVVDALDEVLEWRECSSAYARKRFKALSGCFDSIYQEIAVNCDAESDDEEEEEEEEEEEHGDDASDKMTGRGTRRSGRRTKRSARATRPEDLHLAEGEVATEGGDGDVLGVGEVTVDAFPPGPRGGMGDLDTHNGGDDDGFEGDDNDDIHGAGGSTFDRDGQEFSGDEDMLGHAAGDGLGTITCPSGVGVKMVGVRDVGGSHSDEDEEEEEEEDEEYLAAPLLAEDLPDNMQKRYPSRDGLRVRTPLRKEKNRPPGTALHLELGGLDNDSDGVGGDSRPPTADITQLIRVASPERDKHGRETFVYMRPETRALVTRTGPPMARMARRVYLLRERRAKGEEIEAMQIRMRTANRQSRQGSRSKKRDVDVDAVVSSMATAAARLDRAAQMTAVTPRYVPTAAVDVDTGLVGDGSVATSNNEPVDIEDVSRIKADMSKVPSEKAVKTVLAALHRKRMMSMDVVELAKSIPEAGPARFRMLTAVARRVIDIDALMLRLDELLPNDPEGVTKIRKLAGDVAVNREENYSTVSSVPWSIPSGGTSVPGGARPGSQRTSTVGSVASGRGPNGNGTSVARPGSQTSMVTQHELE